MLLLLMNALVFSNYFAAQTSGAILAIGTLTNYKKLKNLLEEFFWDLENMIIFLKD